MGYAIDPECEEIDAEPAFIDESLVRAIFPEEIEEDCEDEDEEYEPAFVPERSIMQEVEDYEDCEEEDEEYEPAFVEQRSVMNTVEDYEDCEEEEYEPYEPEVRAALPVYEEPACDDEAEEVPLQ